MQVPLGDELIGREFRSRYTRYCPIVEATLGEKMIYRERVNAYHTFGTIIASLGIRRPSEVKYMQSFNRASRYPPLYTTSSAERWARPIGYVNQNGMNMMKVALTQRYWWVPAQRFLDQGVQIWCGFTVRNDWYSVSDNFVELVMSTALHFGVKHHRQNRV